MKYLIALALLLSASSTALARECSYRANDGATMEMLNDPENTALFHRADGTDEACLWEHTDRQGGRKITCPSGDQDAVHYTGPQADPESQMTFLNVPYLRACR